MLAILAGGVLAAPLAAFLVRHADASVLGVVVGTLLLIDQRPHGSCSRSTPRARCAWP